MNPLHRFRRALGAVVSRRGREREMDEEIRFHLEQSIAQHRARGLSEAEARRLALAEFGGVEAAKEGVREAWALARLAELGRDVRFALRGVRRRPAYAATVVITLALALGAAGSIWNALWSILAGVALVDYRAWAPSIAILTFAALLLIDGTQFVAALYTGPLLRALYLWNIVLWTTIHLCLLAGALAGRRFEQVQASSSALVAA